MELTKKQMKYCIKAQQGELDAVYMYQQIAAKIKNKEVADKLLKLASDEGRHASVFKKLTNKVLKPKKTNGIFLPILIKLCGAKLVFKIIARGEYAAFKTYEPVVKLFPDNKDIYEVQQDEKKHGDIMMELSKIV